MNLDNDSIYDLSELSSYIVCPESWRLKSLEEQTKKSKLNERSKKSQEIKSRWWRERELFLQMKKQARVIFALLLLLFVVVVFIDSQGMSIYPKRQGIISNNITKREIPNEIMLLLTFLGISIFIWDLLERKSSLIAKSFGLNKKENFVELKDSNGKNDISSNLIRLHGSYDTLIEEKKLIVPAKTHPLIKKIRDRHVIEIIALTMLLEEKIKNKVPYGILIIGEEKRKVKINSTEEKRNWVISIIKEMDSIQNGTPAIALPSKFKCKNCDVLNHCKYAN